MYTVFYIALLVCCFLCLYRIGRGPSAPDRTVAIDILGIVIVGFCAIMSLDTGKDFYLNIAQIIALEAVGPMPLTSATPTSSMIVPSVTHLVEACKRL